MTSDLQRIAYECMGSALSRLEGKDVVYGIVLYMAEDMSSAGIALGTEKHLAKQLAKEHAKEVSDPELRIPDFCFEVCAAMWSSLDHAGSSLRPLNARLRAAKKTSQSKATIERALTGAMKQLRKQLKGERFAADVLLGIQFPEPSDLDLVLRVSKKLNSAAWHRKVVRYCDYELKYYD